MWLLEIIVRYWAGLPTPAQVLVEMLLLAYVLWDRYVIVMGLYRAHLAGKLYGINKTLAVPSVIVGIVADVLVQFTWAIYAFRKLPYAKRTTRTLSIKGWSREVPWFEVDLLVTDRLQRYLRDDPGLKGWRAKRAQWWCTHVLDPLDPTGFHCD